MDDFVAFLPLKRSWTSREEVENGPRVPRKRNVVGEIDTENGSGLISSSPTMLAVDGCSDPDESPNSEPNLKPVEECYGMIIDVKAAFVDDLGLDKTIFSSIATGSFDFQRLLISSRSNYYALQSEHSIPFAILDSQTTKALRVLSDLSSIRIEAVLIGDEIAIQNRQSQQNIKIESIPLYLNIYGNNHIVEDVGRRLSKAHVYLQHPTKLDDHTTYNNPHYLQIPGRLTEDRISSPSSKEGEPKLQHPGLDMIKIFENLEQDQALESEMTNSMILTPLLEHQKKALYFMRQRESGNLNNRFSMWRFGASGHTSYYEHLILKIKAYTPPEVARGGILADDMGLGKTLTTISAIVMTLDEAQNFANAPQDLNNAASHHICPRIKSTLVVAPSHMLLDGWVDEIQSHVLAGTLRVHKYHATGRYIDPETLGNFNIVFTTFATLGSEVSRESSVLKRFAWFRVVLDEAHVIRHQNTKQFRAIFSLVAERRWCLTGTPIQNRLEDLGSLIKFLRIVPFDQNSEFRKHILEPLGLNHEGCDQNLRLLLGSVFLRRTRGLLKVPEPRDETRKLSLSAKEKFQYFQIIAESKKRIDDSISSKSLAKAYNSILQVILQLRILCNNGIAATNASQVSRSHAFDAMATDPQDTLTLTQEGAKLTCAFCSYEIEIVDTTNSVPSGSTQPCLQVLCPDCFSQNPVQLREDQSCFKNDLYNHTTVNVQQGPVQGHSSKLTSLVSNIEQHLREDKSIVFSCWRATLDVLEPILLRHNIKYVRIDGNVSNTARTSIVKTFQEDPAIGVLLMTTGTGAVGLNLTAATRVHLLEPQWNPAVEAQAIGRAVRLGQCRSVTIIRYIMEDTIEKAIQSRQVAKLHLAKMTLDKSEGNAETTWRRVEELRSLIQQN